MMSESFLLLHDKIGSPIAFYSKQHIYLGQKKTGSGRQEPMHIAINTMVLFPFSHK